MFKKLNPANLRLVYSIKTYILKNNWKKITSCSKAVISQGKKTTFLGNYFLKSFVFIYLFIFCGILSLRYYSSDYVYFRVLFFFYYEFFFFFGFIKFHYRWRMTCGRVGKSFFNQESFRVWTTNPLSKPTYAII